MSSLTEGEIFAVAKALNDPPSSGAKGGFWRFGSMSAASADEDLYPWTDGNLYQGFGSTVRKSCGDPGVDLSTDFRLLNIYSAASDWGLYVNGSSVHTTATNTVGFNAAPRLGHSQGNSSTQFEGDFAEIFMFDGKLSASDRTAMEDYVADKYALTF